jgi:hypothetical protein
MKSGMVVAVRRGRRKNSTGHSVISLKTEQRQLFGRVSDEALRDWYYLRIKIRH